jgi:alpha-amylase
MRVAGFALLCGAVRAAPLDAWRDRVIYQVITDRFEGGEGNCTSIFEKVGVCTYGDYCNGTFSGLVSKLDYIQEMGFDAIWISPVVANVGCGYTGYWATKLWEINDHFGGEAGFHELVEAAHARDIFVMVDVVFNHMGHTAENAGCDINDFDEESDYVAYDPFSSPEFFHPFQPTVDWRNWTDVTNWWLFCLPDVDTGSPTVVSLYMDWINWLINEFKIDGLRIDTIPYVEKPFWRILTQNISSHTYAVGEVNAGDCWSEFCPTTEWYAGYMASPEGQVLDAILNYPASEKLRPAFGMDCRTATGKIVPFMPMTELQARFEEMRGNFTDLGALGNFVDSHDTARFLMNRNDPVLLANNLAFMFGMDGIPIVYYGTEVLMDSGAPSPYAEIDYYDAPNLNRWPLWMWNAPEGAAMFKAWLTRIIKFKKSFVTSSSKMVDYFVEDRTYSFLRDQALFVTFSVGQNVSSLEVENDMVAPSAWNGDKVCNALADVVECITIESFNQRFSRIGEGSPGWWTKDGLPQIWVPFEILFSTRIEFV